MEVKQHVILNNWVVKTRLPEKSGQYPIFVLLHGWTGDEKAMWIFAPRLPKSALLIAPRGLFDAGPGGYSWYPVLTTCWPQLIDFTDTVERLLELLNPSVFPEGDFDNIHLVGFSQGAAAAYAFTLLHPEKVSSIASLAGFIPDGAEVLLSSERLTGMPVFITHGTRDRLVPVDRSREAAQKLERSGALVTYCEDDVGHKLSANCFRGLEMFYRHIDK